MEKWLIVTLFGVGIFIISLFFEEMRDYYEEAFEYIISFEWFSDFWDFVSPAFEDIGEFSFYGLAFGLLSIMLIFFTRSYMITPFVKFYEPVGRIFWTIATYVTVFGGGYFLGRAFENT